MHDTILVGTDGSEQANRAVERALTLAEQSGARLHAITVVNTRRYGEPALSSAELVLTELEDRGRKQLDKIQEEAGIRGVTVETHCFHGEPVEEIIRYSEGNDIDLIVLGYQGRTHPKSDIGSTAAGVIRMTDRNTLLV